jgi:hypothetical protein
MRGGCVVLGSGGSRHESRESSTEIAGYGRNVWRGRHTARARLMVSKTGRQCSHASVTATDDVTVLHGPSAVAGVGRLR